jgi:hypothetical protein
MKTRAKMKDTFLLKSDEIIQTETALSNQCLCGRHGKNEKRTNERTRRMRKRKREATYLCGREFSTNFVERSQQVLLNKINLFRARENKKRGEKGEKEQTKAGRWPTISGIILVWSMDEHFWK